MLRAKGLYQSEQTLWLHACNNERQSLKLTNQRQWSLLFKKVLTVTARSLIWRAFALMKSLRTKLQQLYRFAFGTNNSIFDLMDTLAVFSYLSFTFHCKVQKILLRICKNDRRWFVTQTFILKTHHYICMVTCTITVICLCGNRRQLNIHLLCLGCTRRSN